MPLDMGPRPEHLMSDPSEFAKWIRDLEIQLDEVIGTLDDVADGSSYVRYTPSEQSKLSGVEANADVTDEDNVTDALDGATLDDLGSPAGADLVLIQDASDSNVLKVAQYSTFSSGGSADETLIWMGL